MQDPFSCEPVITDEMSAMEYLRRNPIHYSDFIAMPTLATTCTVIGINMSLKKKKKSEIDINEKNKH